MDQQTVKNWEEEEIAAVRFSCYFTLPSMFHAYDFNRRIQMAIDELEPFTLSNLKVYCDMPPDFGGKLSDLLNNSKEPILLPEPLVEKALEYVIYVEVYGDESGYPHLINLLVHMISNLCDEDLELRLKSISKNAETKRFLLRLSNALRAFKDAVYAGSLVENAFSLAQVEKHPDDYIKLFNGAAEKKMVVLDKPMIIEGVTPQSWQATAYIYSDKVNYPSLLIDESGTPILIASHDNKMLTPNGAEHESIPDWIVSRIILIPKMPTIEIAAHCINGHPFMTGFGDCAFNFISPILLFSDVKSMQDLIVMGTLFTGFVDAAGHFFIDHFSAEDGVITELPLLDLYLYLRGIEDLSETLGDYSTDILIDHVKSFTPSLESFDVDDISQH